MSRLTQLTSLLSLASVGLAQIPNIIPFTAVGEWTFPEVDVPGTAPPPFLFTDIRGLVQGDFLDNQQFGPLSPFPGANPPAPSKQCNLSDIPTDSPTTPTTPNAPAVDPVAAAVQLRHRTRAKKNDQLNFKWTQSAGTLVITLTKPNTAIAGFTAPKVTVKISPTAPDVVTVDTYTWESRQGGSIAVSCSSNVRNGDNKKMTLVVNGNTNIPMAVSGGAGKWAHTARSTARPGYFANMSHDPERRLSTGGLPPIKICEQYVIEEAPSHDGTPCYTAWVREEIVQVPHGWSASDFDIANKRPQWSLQIYDTTSQAVNPDHLKSLVETFHKETRKEHGIIGRNQPTRIDIWGMPFTTDTIEEEKIAKCKAHILAEIAARETSGDDDFHVPELCSHHHWKRAILIVDQSEESWNEIEGGFLAVYWSPHPSYVEMLAQAYSEGYREPETSAIRYTRDELGQLLERLRSFF
ncbi:hypothetical protein N0V94_009138 [Neodidymelliopsis sp. IMI 364377]|nr:hypothetical protein N0V94_009138 [Neodidymelliopsis sp. IMI 364377]